MNSSPKFTSDSERSFFFPASRLPTVDSAPLRARAFLFVARIIRSIVHILLAPPLFQSAARCTKRESRSIAELHRASPSTAGRATGRFPLRRRPASSVARRLRTTWTRVRARVLWRTVRGRRRRRSVASKGLNAAAAAAVSAVVVTVEAVATAAATVGISMLAGASGHASDSARPSLPRRRRRTAEEPRRRRRRFQSARGVATQLNARASCRTRGAPVCSHSLSLCLSLLRVAQ